MIARATWIVGSFLFLAAFIYLFPVKTLDRECPVCGVQGAEERRAVEQCLEAGPLRLRCIRRGVYYCKTDEIFYIGA